MPPALGPDWLDPNYLFETYGSGFFWLSLGIVFVECGLFFPFLPGDSLLFAIGLFISGASRTCPRWRSRCRRSPSWRSSNVRV